MLGHVRELVHHPEDASAGRLGEDVLGHHSELALARRLSRTQASGEVPNAVGNRDTPRR